ncbi:Multi antimicrobial extrusion protein [Indibacter alkaliphilus LW1]|jgi:putative MATE family efflux protein|uniref:Multidrug-efflux transporter n=1 Tax=Indibacter alkaliphilus (strain CCUG 57479 / KCTC 22604 / LW1) TaxID=1189612 RepID=S2DUZ6_INDAL|nr:MATE family efflux transporter [Indibacter alkaliphilus]EOZ93653.1 Multi antimicrobial extrusion protein [Indibacter alkaliphilus LW1]
MTFRSFIFHFKKAVKGLEEDFTQISIKKAVFYLSIPMILEMVMESLFAVVDIFFVGKLGVFAVATVGLTESVLTIIYSIAIGLSMAATAIVARRIGEKKPKEASKAAFQAIMVCSLFAIAVAVIGVWQARNMLALMGGETEVINSGYRYTQIIFGGNVCVMLLFLINGIFRGAGNAAIAMKALWIANGFNIVLDPILIFGLGPVPAMGLEGAAWATTTGRGIGVLFQLYVLFKGSSVIKFYWESFQLKWKTVLTILKVASGGMGQFLIESASWIFLMRIVSESGSSALAGYTIAIRLIIFAILPAFGLANASATLVGQNLGALEPARAEKSAWFSAHLTAIFLGVCAIVFIAGAGFFIGIFNQESDVIEVGRNGLIIICLGYVFFGYGMVMSQSLNGAGDTKTPTIINLAVLWGFQIPFAYLMAKYLGMGATGVFIAIAVSHSLHAVVSTWVFNRGSWKLVQV